MSSLISSTGVKPKARTEADAQVESFEQPAWDHRDLPARYRWTLDDYPEDVRCRMTEFLDGGAWSLCLIGAVGTRKTSLAFAVVRHWRQRFKAPYDGVLAAAYFASEVYITQIREMSHWLKDRCRETMLLVLDDIGAARSTPHVVEQLGFILKDRYDRGAKTLITSNLTLDALGRTMDERIADRLREGVTFFCGNASKRTLGNGGVE